MGVSQNGGTQELLVFLLKMTILGVLGVPPFKETPIQKDSLGWNSLTKAPPFRVEFPHRGLITGRVW